MSTVTLPIRVMKQLGITHVIITNAAGGLEPKNPVGTVVALVDHVGLGSLVSRRVRCFQGQNWFFGCF